MKLTFIAFEPDSNKHVFRARHISVDENLPSTWWGHLWLVGPYIVMHTIVKFVSKWVKTTVMDARKDLKDNNPWWIPHGSTALVLIPGRWPHPTQGIAGILVRHYFYIETSPRALKQSKAILDTWTFKSPTLVRDNHKRMGSTEINLAEDLVIYQLIPKCRLMWYGITISKHNDVITFSSLLCLIPCVNLMRSSWKDRTLSILCQHNRMYFQSVIRVPYCVWF